VPVVPRMSAVAVMANIRATEPTNMFVRVLIVANEANIPRCGAVAVGFAGPSSFRILIILASLNYRAGLH
jgi:hypothetical protein